MPAWSRLTACLQSEPDQAWLHELRGFASYQIAGLARQAAENLHARGGTLLAEIEHQLQSAEADYQRALDLLEKAPSPTLRYAVLLNRGLLWIERREWDKAETDLRAAMRLDDRQWQPSSSWPGSTSGGISPIRPSPSSPGPSRWHSSRRPWNKDLRRRASLKPVYACS